jgi:hypothetical protein
MAAPSGDDPAGFPECAGLTTIRRSCSRRSRKCLGYLAERDAEGGGRILVGSGSAAVSHRELTTALTTTMTTVGLPDTFTYTTTELVSCLVEPSACAYGSEGSRKSVVVYSTPMTRNRPELPGSGRSRWTTNHLVTQQKIRSNGTYPDLWVANPLVAGSSAGRPTVWDQLGASSQN